MTVFQRVVKYCAMALAVYLVIMIVGGILAGVGSLSFVTDRLGGSDLPDEGKIYSINQDIGEIDIELGATDFEIVTGDIFAVESNSSKIKVSDLNGRLVIEDGMHNLKSAVKVKLYIPTDAHIRKIDISAGAGDIYAESLVCSSLSLECGAGNMEIGEAVATVKSDIEGGIGEITIGSGSLNDLDLEMGVGNLDLTSRLKGDCDLEFGVGDADITLIGSSEDYVINYGRDSSGMKASVNIEKGIGTVKIDYAQAG